MGYFNSNLSSSIPPNSIGSEAVIDKSLLPVDFQDGTAVGQQLVTDLNNAWIRSPEPATTPSWPPTFMQAGDPSRPNSPVVITQMASGASANLHEWRASNGDLVARISANGVLYGDGAELFNVTRPHTHGAADIVSGIIDGTHLPSISADKPGAVPPTGYSTGGSFLCDNGTWRPAGGANGLAVLDEYGTLSAGVLTGTLPILDAHNLMNVVASSLAWDYIVPTENLPLNITYQGNSFNAANQLVLLDGSGSLPALNGFALNQINAANVVGILDGNSLPPLSFDKPGAAPAVGSPTGRFLRDDGTWQLPGAGYSLITEDGGANSVTLNNGSQFSSLHLGSIVLEGVYPVTIYAPANGQPEQYTWPYTQTSLGTLSSGDLVLTHFGGLLAWKQVA